MSEIIQKLGRKCELLKRFHMIKEVKYWILLSVVTNITTTDAAFENLTAGGRSAGMGSAYVAVAEGPESIFINPGGIAQSSGPSVCFFLSQPYGIHELTYEGASFLLPTSLGKIGLSIKTFGNKRYSENIYAFTWGNRYGMNCYYGISIRTAQLQIHKYGSETVILADAGFLFKFTNNLICGVSVSNLNQGKIGKSKEPLPQVTRTGLSYKPCSEILLSIELDKDVHFPPEVRGGFEIYPIKKLCLRCGFVRSPSKVTFGAGFHFKKIIFNYAFTIHPVLGSTHQGSLSINWNSPEQ
jgi:hypothetical protein